MGKLVSFLSSHPDRAFTSYILDGLTHGFRIGFERCNPLPHSCPLNHPSALANKTKVDEKIATELAAGRLYGPLPENLASQVHISPMGLVPKPHQLNKFRLIVDLSHPAGFSINDGIPPSLCSLYSMPPSTWPSTWSNNWAGYTTCETRYQGCLPHHTDSPSRPPPARYIMAGQDLCRQGSPFWSPVRPKDL